MSRFQVLVVFEDYFLAFDHLYCHAIGRLLLRDGFSKSVGMMVVDMFTGHHLCVVSSTG